MWTLNNERDLTSNTPLTLNKIYIFHKEDWLLSYFKLYVLIRRWHGLLVGLSLIIKSYIELIRRLDSKSSRSSIPLWIHSFEYSYVITYF